MVRYVSVSVLHIVVNVLVVKQSLVESCKYVVSCCIVFSIFFVCFYIYTVDFHNRLFDTAYSFVFLISRNGDEYRRRIECIVLKCVRLRCRMIPVLYMSMN